MSVDALHRQVERLGKVRPKCKSRAVQATPPPGSPEAAAATINASPAHTRGLSPAFSPGEAVHPSPQEPAASLAPSARDTPDGVARGAGGGRWSGGGERALPAGGG
ncbi:hypothetical protein T484DRAFT_1840970, partial [Baffinella frigidus]